MISMTALWDDTSTFIRRERALLVPLALATLVVGSAGSSLISYATPPGDANPSAWLGVAQFLCFIISMTGQLSILALVLRDRLSIGEALTYGASCLSKTLTFILSMMGGIMLLAIPLAVYLVVSGVDLTKQPPQLPPFATFYILGMLVFLVWFGARVFPMLAIIVDQRPSTLSAFRTSFALTRGDTARLIGVTLTFGLVVIIASVTTELLAGLVFIGGAKLIGVPFLGHVLAAFAQGLVLGGLSVFGIVFTALYYRRAVEASSKGI
jgi:hypothetical protein